MYKKIELKIGTRFGRLVVLGENGRGQSGDVLWKCFCDCGVIKNITASNLVKKRTLSCGCLMREVVKKVNVTHGMCGTPSYILWQAIKRRCYYKKAINYVYYGSRGIKVCPRWLKFENFLADMGECPRGKSLDRIDNNKGYSPKNCRWATPKEQANNRRNTILVTHNGKTLTLKQWSRIRKIDYHTVYSRIYKLGWGTNKALGFREIVV